MRYNYDTIGTRPDAADRWLQKNGIKKANRKIKRNMRKAIEKIRRVEKVKRKDMSKDWHRLLLNNMHDKTLYAAYLCSKSWRKKQNDIKERCNSICEDCRQYAMVDVYHVTYENIGDERLEDLLGLCVACHQKKHPDKKIERKTPPKKAVLLQEGSTGYLDFEGI